MFLGNDLVHWNGAAALEKEAFSRRTRRFIDRVLHEREHPVLDHLGTLRDRTVAVPLSRGNVLWSLWAAKEATFKAAVKAIPGLPFSPRAIRVELITLPDHYEDEWPLRHGSETDGGGSRPLAYGMAYVRNQVYEILWEYHEEFVHALALGPIPGEQAEHQRRSFGDHWTSVVRKLTNIPTDRASAAARRIAVSLYPVGLGAGTGTEANVGDNSSVRTLRVVRNLLTNGRLGPPLFHDGVVRDDVDLTLSHDGPWGAAAVLRRAALDSVPSRTPRPGLTAR